MLRIPCPGCSQGSCWAQKWLPLEGEWDRSTGRISRDKGLSLGAKVTLWDTREEHFQIVGCSGEEQKVGERRDQGGFGEP